MADDPKGERDCMTCKYRDEIYAPPPQIGKMNVCRQGPPVPIVFQTAQGIVSTPAFPAVGPGVWCYRWRPDRGAAKVVLAS